MSRSSFYHPVRQTAKFVSLFVIVLAFIACGGVPTPPPEKPGKSKARAARRVVRRAAKKVDAKKVAAEKTPKDQLRSLVIQDGHSSVVTSVAFSPDGRFIVSASHDNTLKFWNMDGRLLKTVRGHSNRIEGVAFSPDSKLIVSASHDNTLKLWGVDGRRQRTIGVGSAQPSSVTFSPDGKIIASGCSDNTVKLWDVNGKLFKTLKGHLAPVTSVAFSPDSTMIASASQDKTINLWQMDGTLIRTIDGHKDWVTSVAFSPDGGSIVSGSRDKTIKVWHTDGKLLQTIEGHEGWVTSVAFSPDGKVIASAGGDNMVKLWQLDGSLIKALMGHLFSVTHIAFSSDGKTVASASRDNTIKFWSIDGKLYKTLDRGHSHEVMAVALSPDGKIIASAYGDYTVKLWSTDGYLLTSMKMRQQWINSIKFQPKGNIFTLEYDDSVEYWDIDGRLLRKMQRSGSEGTKAPDARVLKTLRKGHAGDVTCVVSSSDGQLSLSGSTDTTFKLWNKDLEPIATFHGFDNGEWIILTTDGYYNASLEGGRMVVISFPSKSGLEGFGFEQFESVFKRPDIIKERIASGGKKGEVAPTVTRPPSITMAEHRAVKKTTDEFYMLKLGVSDNDKVKSVRVFVNGKMVKEEEVNAKKQDLAMKIKLNHGENRVTAIAYNDKGFASNPKYLDMASEQEGGKKPALYVFAVGVNEYTNLGDKWQLEYAQADAISVIDAFAQQEGLLYDYVFTNLMTNEEVDVHVVQDVLDALAATEENDLVVMFMAGHGIRGDDGTFYYLTSGATIKPPYEGNIRWSDISEGIAAIKGRVILFLDACHSGAITTETVVPNDALLGAMTEEGRTGVMVFSAAKGRQSSLEGPDLDGGHGAFAYALIHTVTDQAKEADTNQNGVVEFSELTEYITSKVETLSAGYQTPWIARQEIFGDFPLAKVP